jgi:hypothetical protein
MDVHKNVRNERKKGLRQVPTGRRMKASRGDWTPLELFVFGVPRCEAGLRRFFNRLPDDE